MNRSSIRAAALTVLAALSTPSWADPAGRGHGHDRHAHDDLRSPRHRYAGSAYTEQYLDGACRVQRKWDKHGRYKEQRRCQGPAGHGPHVSERHGIRYPAGVAVLQPAIVIQPPALVIRP